MLFRSPRAGRFPWGALLLGVAVVALLMMVFRRRTYNTYPSVAGPGMGGTPGGYGPGYGPPPMGGGKAEPADQAEQCDEDGEGGPIDLFHGGVPIRSGPVP